jgi:tRNA (guanosine-2'-O-)-methyltransferase
MVMSRGYFGIGVWGPKYTCNIGGLVRSADCFSADFVFTIGRRYEDQASDVSKAARNMPVMFFRDVDEFISVTVNPNTARADIVAVEITDDARDLVTFVHPERAIYLLGGEDRTLPQHIIDRCNSVVKINTKYCLNLASAATVVMYDRKAKEK